MLLNRHHDSDIIYMNKKSRGGSIKNKGAHG